MYDKSFYIIYNIYINNDLLLFVVNSLSLAFAERMKSAAMIIGVKHKSQSYFLTKHLKANLKKKARITIQNTYDMDKISHNRNEFNAVKLTLSNGPWVHIL